MFPRGRGWHCLPRDSWFTEAPVDPRTVQRATWAAHGSTLLTAPKPVEIHGNPWEICGTSMDNMDKSSWYDISRLYQSGNFGSVPHFSYTRMNHDIDQLVVHLVGTLSWRWMTLIGLLSCAVSVVLLSLFFLLNWWTNMNKQSQRVYHLPSWSDLLSSCLDSVPSSSSSSRWPWQIKQWNVIFYHYRLSWCLDSFPHLKGNIRKLDLRNKICTGNILFDIFDGWNHGIQWIFLWFSINQPDDLQNWPCISPQAAKLKSDFGDEAPWVDDHILYHLRVSENGDAHILPFLYSTLW